MYYNNITIIKGTQETIENLTSSLIDVKGQVVTLNSYKTNPYYTEVIEIDDYKTYGDTDSEDECLEITFAALGYPVVRFWESDDFAITQDGIHSIEVKSYNPTEQTYIYNYKCDSQEDSKTIYMAPFHGFKCIEETVNYFVAISQFISDEKLNAIIRYNVKDIDEEIEIRESVLNAIADRFGFN